MRKIYLFLIVVVTMMSCNTSSVSVFDRVERLCNKDGGEIWGINIYSPVIGIDSLRNIISNVQDAPTVYPSDLPVANSTTEFDGKRWTMVLWPLSGSVQSQNTLLIHEMFHYRQSELKLIPTLTPNNAHLSFRDARTLIKLEWNALNKDTFVYGVVHSPKINVFELFLKFLSYTFVKNLSIIPHIREIWRLFLLLNINNLQDYQIKRVTKSAKCEIKKANS